MQHLTRIVLRQVRPEFVGADEASSECAIYEIVELTGATFVELPNSVSADRSPRPDGKARLGNEIYSKDCDYLMSLDGPRPCTITVTL